MLLFSCVIVALSSAISAPKKTPKFTAPHNNTALGVNGQGSPSLGGGNRHAYANDDCAPNDYTITTTTGTIVPGTTDTGNHCDDCIMPIALPFPVTFYDETFFSVGISSNGNLQFTGANQQDFTNDCLPTANLTDLIAPYWDDLCTIATGQGVFTSVTGTAPNRIFNIEWRANFGCATGVALNFEVCLHEDTPNFEIIYGRLEDCETTGCKGSGATVGAQRDTGSHFTQFECNTGGLADGLQLNFVYASGCASPTPTPAATATATATFTPTATATATFTPTPTATATATSTPTPTPSATPIQVSQITPTGTRCRDFSSGTADTLSSVQYSVKNGVISQTNPGVFFYWVKVTAPAGNNTFTITQTITTGNFSSLFDVASGSDVFSSSCNSVGPTITQNPTTKAVTVAFNAPAAGTYFIGIKYSVNSVVGSPAPSPGTTVHYNLMTTGVPGSTSGLDLVLKP
jgi:hypothetical protein